jgi:probable rRNA maturation factor
MITVSERKVLYQIMQYTLISFADFIFSNDKLLALKKIRTNLDSIQVNVMLVGDYKMKNLNRHFRAKNYLTDVLTFNMFDDLRIKSSLEFNPLELELGDIVISHNKARNQARIHKINFVDELIHLLVHGLVHIVGYDHELSKHEERLMQQIEVDLITQISSMKTNA